ncbi:MAG: diguanylate cyclase [Deltaproteobacteria bacterium]|nr:diguanylate cyclase [Deltaproteobacteria bacterium]
MNAPLHTILIIDDEVDNLHALERTLKNVAEVLTAESGAQGLKLIEQRPIELVICDQRMPQMTGIDFFKILKEKHPDIVRIILTGYTDIEDLISAINEVGLYRYITKPWNNHELGIVIQRALEHHDAQKQNRTLVQELKRMNESLEKTVSDRTHELKEANHKLQELSLTDDLTHLRNGRFFKEKMAEELNRSLRYKHPVSIILLDIDHFKKINDVFGHKTGDQALQKIAHILQKNIRNTDFAARIGGEEFVILLPETSKPQAQDMAERLRKAISKTMIFSREKKMKKQPLTASFGVSSYPHDKTKNAKKLLALADKALYRAKKKGRNRIEG